MAFTLDLTGHLGLVTGAGQGVGRGVAIALATAGAEVIVNDIDPDRARQVVDQIESAGGTARALPFDVSDFEIVSEAIASLNTGVDILVNNAGNAGVSGFDLRKFATTAPADWQRYFAVNLFGVLHCTRAVLPSMIEQGHGRVITIISDAARTGEPNLVAYAAAKGGAASFSRALAHEVGRSGITVNNISLGTMQRETAHSSDTPDDAAFERLMQRYIIRRPGTPADVAGLVTFLASDHASWITGQTIPVNGGYSINQ